jgi:hypothetical protein
MLSSLQMSDQDDSRSQDGWEEVQPADIDDDEVEEGYSSEEEEEVEPKTGRPRKLKIEDVVTAIDVFQPASCGQLNTVLFNYFNYNVGLRTVQRMVKVREV